MAPSGTIPTCRDMAMGEAGEDRTSAPGVERAGGSDDRHGAVVLGAPHLDVSARAGALRDGLAHLAASRDRVGGPHDVHQAHVELAAGEEPRPVARRHQVRDQAHGHHPLDDDVRESERARHLDVGVVVPARPRERLAHRMRDRTCCEPELFAVTGGELEAAVGALLARAVDDHVAGRRIREEALMRAAPLEPTTLRIGEHHLRNDVVATAPAVPIDDRRSRAHRLAGAQWLQQVPFLARMEVPDQVRQVPRQVPVALGMIGEGGSELPGVDVARRPGPVALHGLRRHRELSSADVLTDVDLRAAEEAGLAHAGHVRRPEVHTSTRRWTLVDLAGALPINEEWRRTPLPTRPHASPWSSESAPAWGRRFLAGSRRWTPPRA